MNQQGQGAPIKDVSDTAFWVAYYRVIESNRKDALFKDPLANKLVDDRAERIAHSMKETSPYTQYNVVIRTVIIDDFIKSLSVHGVS